MTDPIRFLAALSGTNTSARWLSVDKDGGGKISLEIPPQSLAQVLRLAVLGDKVLKITVETE